jgi:outer membrane protein assembly factor BamE (lipoprotein component of BamABCDE complex)
MRIKIPMASKTDTIPQPSARSRLGRLTPALALACVLAGPLVLAGCGGFGETLQRGYVLPEGALEQIPIGATQEQVLIVLGTPSTVATVDGDAFYYISQKAERSAAFMPHETVDQRVIAVYFDKNRVVTRLANYGIKDGKIFDFVSQTTETGGEQLNYLRSVFRNFKMF